MRGWGGPPTPRAYSPRPGSVSAATSRCSGRRRIAQARLSAAEGTVTLAVGRDGRAGAEAAQGRQFGIEADALHTAARLGDQRVAARSPSWPANSTADCVAVHARRAAAVAASDGPALDAAAADYETIGALLSAADAAAQAAVAPTGRRSPSARGVGGDSQPALRGMRRDDSGPAGSGPTAR